MSRVTPTVKICASLSEISDTARALILDVVGKRSDTSKPIVLAISGGSTPKMLYRHLHDKDIALLQSHAFKFILGDERLLAPEDEESNFSMAYKAFLHEVPASDIIAVDPSAALLTSMDVDAGIEGAWKVAADYEAKLLAQLPVSRVELRDGEATVMPEIDVVLLGFGSDGHTASIFPDSVAAADETHVVSVSFPSPSMSPKVWRITLSKAVIHHAKHVIVLAAGKDKSWVVDGVLSEKAPEHCPVSRFLRDCTGTVTLLLDADSGAGVPAAQ